MNTGFNQSGTINTGVNQPGTMNTAVIQQSTSDAVVNQQVLYKPSTMDIVVNQHHKTSSSRNNNNNKFKRVKEVKTWSTKGKVEISIGLTVKQKQLNIIKLTQKIIKNFKNPTDITPPC